MAMSTIDRVKAAELQANEDRDNAELEAKSIIDEANTKAQAIINEAKEGVQKYEKERIDEASKNADALVASRRAKAQEEAEALRNKTMKLKQNVINMLVKDTLEKNC